MTLVVEEPTRRCPVDGSEMAKAKRKGVVVDICRRCRGVWLDPGEIRLLSEGYEDFDLKVTPRTFLRWRRALGCPSCTGHIVTCAYVGFGERVDIGTCRRCSGLWFDQQYLQRFQSRRAFPRPPAHRREPFFKDVEPRGSKECIAMLVGYSIDIDNPCLLFPYMTWVIIGVNVLVFSIAALWVSDRHLFVRTWGLVGSAVANGQVLQLFTYLFIHGSLGHLAGNLFFLHTFGDNIEERFGAVRFTLLYFLCGISAGLFSCLLVRSSLPRIGASGAISGVMGAYLIAFPRTHLLVPSGGYTFVRVRTQIFVVWWCLLQIVGWFVQTRAGRVGGVDFAAHVGGVLTGILGGWLMVRERSRLAFHQESTSLRA